MCLCMFFVIWIPYLCSNCLYISEHVGEWCIAIVHKSNFHHCNSRKTFSIFHIFWTLKIGIKWARVWRHWWECSGFHFFTLNSNLLKSYRTQHSIGKIEIKRPSVGLKCWCIEKRNHHSGTEMTENWLSNGRQSAECLSQTSSTVWATTKSTKVSQSIHFN